ncbi:MAG TPA: ATP-binding cassette domain-containing protein [Pirellulaceae bacterium]|nr:ATP-binding cassette domain-containing protein [Pirellulaceae bacterium]
MNTSAVQLSELTHRYGQRIALNQLTLTIARGEVFVFLGPNGGGKTTLFRLLSTLLPPQSGNAEVLGYDLRRSIAEVRLRMGVVFQSPSLDKKLTVVENIRFQAALYGLSGKEYALRQAEMLEQLGLADRAHDLVETLSGGLRRRVELAKGLIHRPELLLLDEPSTGLDPGARADLWAYLLRIREESGVTIVLTTHLLEEADKADRIAILNRGELVALDTPDQLRAMVGGDSITIETDNPALLASDLTTQLQIAASVVDGRVRLEQAAGHQWIARIVEAFPGRIASITLGKPTLEDVFIEKTGHRFWQAEETPS